MISDQITGVERMAYIASFFQGTQGEILRIYLDAQVEGRKAAEQHAIEQERLGENTEKTTGALQGQTEAVKKYKEEFTMLGAKYREFNQLMEELVQTTPQKFYSFNISFDQFFQIGQ